VCTLAILVVEVFSPLSLSIYIYTYSFKENFFFFFFFFLILEGWDTKLSYL
jgi:hypothetical protein